MPGRISKSSSASSKSTDGDRTQSLESSSRQSLVIVVQAVAVAIPGSLVPNLKMVARADDIDFLFQMGVIAQLLVNDNRPWRSVSHSLEPEKKAAFEIWSAELNTLKLFSFSSRAAPFFHGVKKQRRDSCLCK